MATAPANLAMDGGDPRLSLHGPGIAEYNTRKPRKTHDSSVTFEEYLFYARLSRAEEKQLPPAKHPISQLLGFGRSKKDHGGTVLAETIDEPSTKRSTARIQGLKASKTGEKSSDNSSHPNHAIVTDEEWVRASRASRTAGWAAVFYLITTDILGPYTTPWAMRQMGLGPGIVLYTVFGALAGYTGWMLWHMFLHLDSTQYPMRTYGDIAFRIYGMLMRHTINILQSIQLIFNVGVIIIGNGQGLNQVNSNICFIVCCLIWALIGLVLGQIRTLQRLGWLASLAIFLNLTVLILTMAVVAHTAPNYTAAESQNNIPYGNGVPVTTAGPPPDVAFQGQVVGLMQAVYSYGGAMLFCEFMAEMRKPWDFWKGLILAEAFIYSVYLFFGVFVYYFQGQYVINPAQQGISPYTPQTAANIIYFLSCLIAAALYGNIGIKVLYQNMFKEVLGLPDLTSRAGKFIWVAMVPIYWGLAFVLAAAIPNFSALSGLVAAVCILQFTYTFPPFLYFGFAIKRDAMLPGEGFDPTTGRTTRRDKGVKRWLRGCKKRWYLKLWYVLFCLGSLATAVLGAYSSVVGIVASFDSGSATAFGCKNPVG